MPPAFRAREFLLGGQLFAVDKALMVKARAHDPLAVRRLLRPLADHLQQLLQGFSLLQIQLEAVPGIVEQVLMGIDHTGQHRSLVQVHHFSAFGDPLGLLIRAAVKEFSILHYNCAAQIALGFHGIDFSVDIRCCHW